MRLPRVWGGRVPFEPARGAGGRRSVQESGSRAEREAGPDDREFIVQVKSTHDGVAREYAVSGESSGDACARWYAGLTVTARLKLTA